MADPAAAALDRLAADAGRITVPISRSYPLAEVPAAFGDFAGGKLAVTLAELPQDGCRGRGRGEDWRSTLSTSR